MTTQIHPKAAEAQAAAAKRREEREAQAKLVADLKQRGVRFVHLGDGRVTVAFRVDRHNVVHAANTIRHPNDTHDSLLAKAIAGQRFMNNQYVTLRKPPDTPFCTATVKQFIQATFHLTACR